MIGPALLLAMQATTAAPVDPAPLAAGRWVFRETREIGTGIPAASATLLSNDGAVRLIVRCDLGYQRTVSLQILRSRRDGPIVSLPVSLGVAGAKQPFPLDWEQAALGVFARDSDDSSMASVTAGKMGDYPEPLSLEAAASDGRLVKAEFDNRSGQEQVRRVLDACAPVEAAGSSGAGVPGSE